jgi:predicted RNA-binding Zn-ribbon protein involved in translation (DUF1610 family)
VKHAAQLLRSEKLGSYLTRRNLKGRLLGYAVIGGITLTFFRVESLGYLPLNRPDRVMLAAIIALAAMVAAVATLVRCPRCAARLIWRAPRRFSGTYPGACPRCGASFDEPFSLDRRSHPRKG